MSLVWRFVPHGSTLPAVASGEGTERRAASVRELPEDAADRAFGTTEDERLLREVLIRAYFDPAPSLEAAAGELHMSRSSFFRRLKTAVARLAEFVRAEPA